MNSLSKSMTQATNSFDEKKLDEKIYELKEKIKKLNEVEIPHYFNEFEKYLKDDDDLSVIMLVKFFSLAYRKLFKNKFLKEHFPNAKEKGLDKKINNTNGSPIGIITNFRTKYYFLQDFESIKQHVHKHFNDSINLFNYRNKLVHEIIIGTPSSYTRIELINIANNYIDFLFWVSAILSARKSLNYKNITCPLHSCKKI